LPKSLAGFADVHATVQAAIAAYRAEASALGVPNWTQEVVVRQHPIMGLLPWLASFHQDQPK